MKKLTCSILLLLAIFVQNISSQVSAGQQAVWDKENSVPENPLLEHRPNRLPDRILITPFDSNNKTLNFTWRTDTTIRNGVLEIVKGDVFSFPKENTMKIQADFKTVSSKDFPMHYHKVEVKGLESGKTYKYRVGNSPNWSRWHTYKHEDFSDTLKFFYFGDVQNGIYRHTTKIFKEAVKNFGEAQLAVFSGDIIAHANNDYEWGEWHAAVHDVSTSIPIIATPGNHEYIRDLNKNKTISSYWKTIFPYPYKHEVGNYFLDYEFVRFIVLNSNEDVENQGKWMEDVLSKTEQDWVVIISHYPVFSGAKGRNNVHLQNHWLPVIEKYKLKIGLVLQGHDHTYSRGGLLDRTGTPDKPSAPVFVLSYVGEKRYELANLDWMDVAFEGVSTYQYIEITKNKISYKSFSETNTMIDAFEIEK